jgi:nucleoside-diphosphate-sugar epimerase
VDKEVNGINVRLYGCFGSSEDPNRFLAINIKNYINKKPIKIFKNRQMDFMYVKDIYKNTLYAIENNIKDINCVYEEKKYLTDIADVVNNLNDHSVDIIVENEGFDSPYSTTSKLIDVEYIGLEKGIKECYEDYLR